MAASLGHQAALWKGMRMLSISLLDGGEVYIHLFKYWITTIDFLYLRKRCTLNSNSKFDMTCTVQQHTYIYVSSWHSKSSVLDNVCNNLENKKSSVNFKDR